MRVRLTAKQVQQLAPYFDRVHATSVMGSPGMLVGQFGYTRDREYYLTVAFLDHDKAQVITQAGRSEIPGPSVGKRRRSDDSTPKDSHP